MGIISRFKDIMSSNINALLDKAEDPAKMVDQYLRNLQDDLGKVKAETAGIMAEETRAKRQLDENAAEIAKLQDYAEKAVVSGNDDDARSFLSKKAALTEKQAAFQQAYDLASANATKMRQMHDRLTEQIQDLNNRRDTIKAKVAVAKTQERVNQIGSSLDKTQGNLDAFARMESKADNMLDKANAMAELNTVPNDGVEDLKKKYAANPVVVEDELAALKAKLGK
ncbi:MAG: PspA/IM30 family protein [Oscillospiraceae bacterium]|jgi:phage shock protein A|nr:PspA/IM30 family protein [Oscillospiraceae bacterium]